MSDIIRLLPDSVANQIAAGEVIQRPASAVKELLENAVDAGATQIKLIVKEAGKTLIQVIDNGSGMTETDARMAFERHATSKLSKAEDLFSIRTKGFRGEAMASVAAVAQVEMRTRRKGEETGTRIEIEGTQVTSQEPTSCPEGTSISIKNLYFNIPARRNFLKSNAVETKHIIEEFQRVALAHPEIAFEMHQNGLEVHHLPVSSLRQRIVAVFGNGINENLVPLNELTSILNINGFVTKPDFAKKTRGDQYFFINQRYIRDPYLNHAVTNAYDQLLPQGSYPAYFLYIDLDPARIDINIHPTKTEVKFEDEKSIYAIIRSAVKHSLGQYSVAPALDFEQSTDFSIPYIPGNAPLPKAPTISINPNYNPFHSAGSQRSSTLGSWPTQSVIGEDERLFGQTDMPDESLEHKQTDSDLPLLQIDQRYIFAQQHAGFILLDQQAVHEKILYERYIAALTKQQGPSQQELFPKTLEVSPENALLLMELQQDIRALGFDVREFGKNTFVIHGVPADMYSGDAGDMIESLLEQFKQNNSVLKVDKRQNLARSMARQFGIKAGAALSSGMLRDLINDWMQLGSPMHAPSGKMCSVHFTPDQLDRLFKK